MSRLFEDRTPHHTDESEPDSMMTTSIVWMLLLRTSGMLVVGVILGLLIYRHVPRGRHALWRLLKSQKAESHMHAVSVGRDNDDYPVWRAAAPSAVLHSYGIDRESVSITEGDLKGLLSSPHKDVTTLKDLLIFAADKHKGARALGQRKLIKEHKQKKTINGEEKQWTLYEKSPFEWLTFSQVFTQVKQLSCGILPSASDPGNQCVSSWTHAWSGN